MLDFLIISTKTVKGMVEIYPKFKIGKSKDLMIRAGDFYAVWLEEKGLWTTDEDEVVQAIDKELDIYAQKNAGRLGTDHVYIKHMWDSETGVIDQWHKYCQKQLRENYKTLDNNIIFANEECKKTEYASKKLPYALESGSMDAYNEIIDTLYDPEERRKIEWAIGAIVTNNAKKCQKFLALYGPPGTGKSTILNIIQMIFEGYCSVFDADSLGSTNASFALEQFKKNPLVAICHDADLSKIESNARLNSLISHEEMTVNEKHKSLYTMKFNSFILIGTNKPVKITDAKSGLIRRLIDVQPSGRKLGLRQYNKLMKQVQFELGAIAYHCANVYEENSTAYNSYKSNLMMEESNDFYNYIEEMSVLFKQQDGVTLNQAWDLYNQYVEDAKMKFTLNKRNFKSELKNYFEAYDEKKRVGDGVVWHYFSGFRNDILESHKKTSMDEHEPIDTSVIDFQKQPSLIDILYEDCPAQYANSKETPNMKWDDVNTTLKDLDTTKLHYVKLPENHIVIDFDLKDETGKKCPEKNLIEASKWPKTYAELSKSGGGIHLHYIYSGDVNELSRLYDTDIEIKIFNGNSSLRRKLSKCNDIPISTINSGLPKKEKKKMLDFKNFKDAKHLRNFVKRNLNKEIHSATKPSIDFIYEGLKQAYDSGLSYDLTDMRNDIVNFAASSTNNSDYCLKLVAKMKFKSEEISAINDASVDDRIVFFDVEVFPNLFLINWKFIGDKTVVRMINPTPAEVESLFKYKLIGYNCRRYDNHIMYARHLGYSNLELYKLSKRIINGEKNCFFGEAYNLSYTDIYDYAAKKQSLKKWEIELGIIHLELGFDWDKEVPENKWDEVAAYCDNDVISAEAVFEATKGDYIAREILADLAGMTVNDTTNSLTTRIIFGKEKNPELVYTELEKEFPGYEFVKKWNDITQKYDKFNMYRGTDLGFGGYVYSEEGMYGNVGLLDIASLHPHSMKAMNIFGKYTSNFTDLMDIRMHIKHKEYDIVRQMFNGKLAKYLNDETTAKALSQALKIAINSVYGLTSASFKNPFRDPRNENNIVALRGALFMRTLQDEVISRGYKVAHIKTDSIKIPDFDDRIKEFCMEFAKKYGYTFEHEATYEKMCLVNDAVYIAKYREKDGKECHDWTATGTQFAVPYVFKTCFSKEPIEFKDMCETKEVKTAMYLDMNEKLNNEHIDDYLKLKDIYSKFKEDENYQPTRTEKKLLECYEDISDEQLDTLINSTHDYKFIGRVSSFCPIKPGCGGGRLVKEQKKKDGSISMDSVTGAKNYRWLESATVKELKLEEYIDISYYRRLVDDAIDTINKYGNYDWFVNDDKPYCGVIWDKNYDIINELPY